MPSEKPRTSFIKRLLLVLGGIAGAVALVGVAELAARWLDPLTPEEQIGRDAFDFQAWTLGPCYRVSLGKLVPVRPPHEIVPGADETFPLQKPPGVRRIVVVGESTGEMLENQLAKLTAHCHDKVEVLRCAASGSRPMIAVRRAQEAMEWSPDVLVVAIGHNFMLPGPPSVAQLEINRSRLIHEAHKIFPSTPAPPEPPSQPTGLDALDPPAMGRTAYEQILAAAKPKGVQVVALVLGSNLWLPPNPAPGEEASLDRARARVQWALGDLTGAIQTLKPNPDDGPLRAYERARYEVEAGDWQSAKADFEKARDLEPNPTRASAAVTDQILATAQRGGASLVDVAGIFGPQTPRGLPGWETYFDNVHPNPEPLRQLAIKVLDVAASVAADICVSSASPPELGPPDAYSALVDGPASMRLPQADLSIDQMRRAIEGPITRLMIRSPETLTALERYDQERLAQTPPAAHAAYLVTIARTARDGDRLDLARWCLDRAIAVAPSATAYLDRAVLELRSNEMTEARADYEQAAALDRTVPLATVLAETLKN